MKSRSSVIDTYCLMAVATPEVVKSLRQWQSSSSSGHGSGVTSLPVYALSQGKCHPGALFLAALSVAAFPRKDL